MFVGFLNLKTFSFFFSPIVLLPSVGIRANDFLGYDVIESQSFKPKRGLTAHPAQVLHFEDMDTGSSGVNWEDLQMEPGTPVSQALTSLGFPFCPTSQQLRWS